MKVLVLTRYGRLGASSRMRFLQFLPLLEHEGIEFTVAPFVNDAQLEARYQEGGYQLSGLLNSYWQRVHTLMRCHNFDLLWIDKESLPWLPAWLELKLYGGVPYVLDYDDAVFHRYDGHRLQLVRRCFGDRIDRLMAGARLVVVGNGYLAQRARDAGASWVEVVPTVIDLSRYPIKLSSPLPNAPLRIVWIGTPSTVRYLALLSIPLELLSKQYPFILRIIGRDPLELPGINIEFVPWSEASEVESILDADIGIMPLSDSPWERGKCGYKLIQYMACGLPVVASPVGVNTEIVRNGTNGFLADTDAMWFKALSNLIDDVELRKEMGSAGRKYVEAEYCIQQVGPRIANLLFAAANKDN